ncbi:MAG: enoyl-CoA hydratase/isomerase family protein [Pelagimonas sp.]|jgi:2-(1,2-epoxy-1,2-dihydrophenyl)acetyl-CoA isomerase|nr:enoyl-CoA hydratase/isomerase family protein [Pelagimonas sp.]
MSDKIALNTIDLPGGDPCFCIQMQAPRANALEPDFLSDLHRAFDALERSGIKKALLTGGRNFSSGGDVGRFHEASERGDVQRYATQVVPVLQELVMRMIELPVLTAAALQGAATGGSAGLIFASDLVAASHNAFVQPYYGVMGYAPDGGWTATLPELIGAGAAQGWLLANHRFDAEDLLRLGLVQSITEDPRDAALALLGAVETGSALATKSMIWNDSRKAAVSKALDAETQAFLNLIDRDETRARMTHFLQATG